MSLLFNDPILLAMDRHDVLWGDLLADDTFNDRWIQPLLLTRKDIWTHFPVTVVPLGSDANGAECHAIQWHRSNLSKWLRTWNVPRAILHNRLMMALNDSSKWHVEPARNNTMLCVIRMRFASAVVPTLSVSAQPPLHCLNDIKTYYPVVWHRVESQTEYPVYSVELYTNMLVRMSKASGYDVTEKITQNLMNALKASPAWIVLQATTPKEFCRLQIVPGMVNKGASQ